MTSFADEKPDNDQSRGHKQRSYLFTLRDTARQCPNVLTQKLLRDAADHLAEAIDYVHLMPTIEYMQELNAAWARAARVLATAELPGGDSTSGGALKDPALLREAA